MVSVVLVLAGISHTFFVPIARGTFNGPLTLYLHASFLSMSLQFAYDAE